MRVVILIIALLYYALVINAFTSAAGKRQHIQYHNSQIIAKSTSSCDDDTSEDNVMIIFRSPSHHTYGFIQSNNDDKYDLPMVELRTLMHDEQQDIQFIPINNDLQSPSTKQPKQLSRNQSKKRITP